MANIPNSDRKLVSVTMQSDLYEALARHCRHKDVPMTVWVRQLIRTALDDETSSAAGANML
jgi:hypothetical protein